MKPDANKQQGFSLIEVLVAGFVITFGLVGMVLMQTYTQQDAFRAHQLSLAGLYAQDMQERLRANICYLNRLTQDSDVNTFINNQRDEWQDDHSLSSRGWTYKIEPLTEVSDFTNPDPENYWQFELEIKPPPPSRSPTVQTLLIDYWGGGC
ncbi:prepilin-type N-terminal cleavage/methylation domain-containing protein [Marinospirillum sp.]|uniref:type IV pilus modification PilV family protein n=1 Tax=Marinospirillum sp. TaxID=2183934 RepID=UPI00286FE203|nr:prepilin-type N-terminal cleavage/methylation domain-containing protein [Marinospirillum sp.]MDR9468852.1 prepilin-type N-terminal cleavage/methylation domain-containing protein [Marinospirillum sp.]